MPKAASAPASKKTSKTKLATSEAPLPFTSASTKTSKKAAQPTSKLIDSEPVASKATSSPKATKSTISATKKTSSKPKKLPSSSSGDEEIEESVKAPKAIKVKEAPSLKRKREEEQDKAPAKAKKVMDSAKVDEAPLAKAKKAVAAPPPDSEADEEEEDDHLHGFSTDEDSSDDDRAPEIPGIDITKIPTIAKDDATVKRKLDQAKKKKSDERGVVVISRIPHGFYEDQMRGYFSQFGDVTRLRLSRNKKTGRSKHYGFVEFDSASVAQIVADTMDNYLLMGHLLQCKFIPKDKVHPKLWIGANKKYKMVPMERVERLQQNKIRTPDEQAKAEQKLLKRQEAKRRKIAEAGIDYNFDGVAYAQKEIPA